MVHLLRNPGHHLEDILVEHGCDVGGHAAFASLDRGPRDQRGSSGSHQVGVARWCSTEEIGRSLKGALVATQNRQQQHVFPALSNTDATS